MVIKILLHNIFDKEKCVLHCQNLQFALRLGSKLKSILRVLELNPSQWLKPYVEFNKKKRIETTKKGDKDEKVLYKLMSNAVYCKRMENLTNRIDIKLVSKELTRNTYK